MTATHMSVKDLADRWNCPRSAIYQQIRSGGLAALHIGQTIRIPLAEIEQFEAANTTQRRIA
ncbi:helix-turn-helix domain-containing protein [Rhodococcus sp. SJ-2]